MKIQPSKIMIHSILTLLLTCHLAQAEIVNFSPFGHPIPSIFPTSLQTLQLVPSTKINNNNPVTVDQTNYVTPNFNPVTFLPLSLQNVILQPIKFTADNFTINKANQSNSKPENNPINYGDLTLYDLAYNLQQLPIAKNTHLPSIQNTQQPNISPSKNNNTIMNTTELANFNSQMENIANQISNSILNSQTLQKPLSNTANIYPPIPNNLNSIELPTPQNLYQYITNKLQPAANNLLNNS